MVSIERRLLAFWLAFRTQEIECGIASGKLVRLGRTITLHSPETYIAQHRVVPADEWHAMHATRMRA